MCFVPEREGACVCICCVSCLCVCVCVCVWREGEGREEENSVLSRISHADIERVHVKTAVR